MSKPKLPKVPKAVRRMGYRPSGQWERGTLPKMFCRSLGFAVVVGIASQFLGLGIPLLLPLCAKLGDWAVYHTAASTSTCGMFIIGLPVILLFFAVGALLVSGYFLFPLAFGSVIGGRVSDLAIKNKTRSLLWVSLLGLVSALAGYAVCLGLRALILGSVDCSYSWRVLQTPLVADWMAELHLLKGSADASAALENDVYARVAFYALFLLDVLLVHGSAILTPYREIRRKPFCGQCNEWYTPWIKRDTKLDVLPCLLRTLEEGPSASAVGLPLVEGLPKATVELEQCPSCQDADLHLTITVTWQETSDSGKPVGQPKTKQWLRVMVPAAFGRGLSEPVVSDAGCTS